MLLTAVRDVVISGNFLKEPHQCGIELDYAQQCLVERNEVYHTAKGATGTDSCALDFDRCCDKTVWQYNYLNENGVGILSCHGINTWDFGSDNFVRYNVFQNCTGKCIFLVSKGGPDYICNNVFYNDKYKNVEVVDSPGKTVKCDTTIANNIFFQTLPGGKLSESANVRYDSNCYWGGVKAPAGDVHAVTTDPRLADPGKGGVGNGVASAAHALDGYKLQTGSPCIGAGVSVPGNAAADFRGTAVKPGKPSIGVFELY